MIRVLVTGGRVYRDVGRVWDALDALHLEKRVTTVVQGGATGADEFARSWADALNIESISVPAEWKVHGLKAGPLRNERMLVEYRPHIVVSFPGGRGTADMVRRARTADVPVWEVPATGPLGLEEVTW